MGLWILKLWLWLCSLSQPRIRDLGAPLRHRFFVWPLDLDENRHMNNSRYLNYMELARWDLNIRSGFMKYALQQRIMAPVLNIAIVYRRSLGPFQRFEVHTRLVAQRGPSLFIEHIIASRGQLYAAAIVEVRAVSRGQSLAIGDLLLAVGLRFEPAAEVDALFEDNAALMKRLLQYGEQQFAARAA